MLTIVIPAHNEEGNIANVVREFYDRVVASLEGAELIVVNDASTDQTGTVVRELAATRDRLALLEPSTNLGHGGSIRYGFARARTPWVFYTDGDFQTRADTLLEMLTRIDVFDLQEGYRPSRGDGFQREVVTSVLRAVVFAATGARLRDANCPYKLMRRDLWERLEPLVPRDSPAAMVCFASLFARLPLRRRLVPIRWHERQAGRASISRWWSWVGVGVRVARDLRGTRRADLRDITLSNTQPVPIPPR